MLLCYAKVGPLFMKYPISDQISDFLDIRIRFSVFPIRTEPYPTFCYPTISVFDFLISAHLLARSQKFFFLTFVHMKFLGKIKENI